MKKQNNKLATSKLSVLAALSIVFILALSKAPLSAHADIPNPDTVPIGNLVEDPLWWGFFTAEDQGYSYCAIMNVCFNLGEALYSVWAGFADVTGAMYPATIDPYITSMMYGDSGALYAAFNWLLQNAQYLAYVFP